MTGSAPARRSLLLALADAGALVAVPASLAAWAAPLHWALELPGHGRLHLGLSLLLAAAVAGLARRRRALLYLLVAGVNLAPVAARAWVAPRGAVEGAATIRVALHNVNTGNRRRGSAVAALAAADADVVAVIEASSAWVAELRAALPEHVHVLAHPQDDNFGMTLFSRVPLEGAEVLWLPSSPAALTARVRLGSRTVTLLVVHPYPPIGTGALVRDRQLAAVARHAAACEGPLVVMGDLNATPWTPCVERLREEAQLADGGAGSGYGATWPARLGPLGIPIDLVLVRDVAVTGFEVGAAHGSDHRALTFSISAP